MNRRKETYTLSFLGEKDIVSNLEPENQKNLQLILRDDFVFLRTCTRMCLRTLVFLVVMSVIILTAIYSGNLEVFLLDILPGHKVNIDDPADCRIFGGCN